MIFTLQKGKRYRTTLTLGFIERLASNEVIAEKFRDAGFVDVTVSGDGTQRYAEGKWNRDDFRPTYPAQISEVAEVDA